MSGEVAPCPHGGRSCPVWGQSLLGNAVGRVPTAEENGAPDSFLWLHFDSLWVESFRKLSVCGNVFYIWGPATNLEKHRFLEAQGPGWDPSMAGTRPGVRSLLGTRYFWLSSGRSIVQRFYLKGLALVFHSLLLHPSGVTFGNVQCQPYIFEFCHNTAVPPLNVPRTGGGRQMHAFQETKPHVDLTSPCGP